MRDFHGKRATTIVNRAAFRYDFSVEQPNSHWHIESEGQSYQPGYTGSIWIDKENYRVLRIELSAQNMPRSFPLDQVESAVDYDYVLIGEGKYLLPVHSEALSCAHGSERVHPQRDRVPELQEIHGRHQHHVRSRQMRESVNLSPVLGRYAALARLTNHIHLNEKSASPRGLRIGRSTGSIGVQQLQAGTQFSGWLILRNSTRTRTKLDDSLGLMARQVLQRL